ncbi:MAG TPA: ABC transporter permease subunit [Bacillales bacterium]|nr:ABC transporter permease subunit [Bacillales bacterium]
MNQWLTLFQKELVEMWRNFKWIWVPITFILLGVKEPLSNYYLPQIIDSLGGLPEGAVIKLPTPTAAEVLVQGLSQYTSIGVLIIILTTMGILSGERKSGVAAMILVKPVTYHSFVSAKWAGGLVILWLSFFVGYLATWYYTGILFDWISMADFLKSFIYYGLWLTFVLTMTVFFSASFLIPGVAGFISITAVIILSLGSSTFSKWLSWSPAQLPDYANTFLMSGSLSSYLFPSILINLICILMLLFLSILIFKKKELSS